MLITILVNFAKSKKQTLADADYSGHEGEGEGEDLERVKSANILAVYTQSTPELASGKSTRALASLLTLFVCTHNVEVLNGVRRRIPMIVLMQEWLEIIIRRFVQMNIWWPEFWRLIPPLSERPLEEPGQSESEEGKRDDLPVRSSCGGKEQVTADPARTEDHRRAFAEYARIVPPTPSFPVTMCCAFIYDRSLVDRVNGPE